MKAKKMMFLVVLAVLMVFATACGNSGNSGGSDNSGGQEEGSTAGSNGQMSGKIIVGGSSALQPLAAATAKKFMKEHQGVQIQIQGGGSGTGLSEVAAGNFNIGMSDIFAEAKAGI
ncbi:MAG TPA: substrate-binding domain-containing protein, partial [Bacillales bacterium]|nr:substrate-binding domain-containing protein [Bacillales bacterium]